MIGAARARIDMTFEQLARRIQRDTGMDAAGIFEVFRAERDSDDVREFLVYLHDEEILAQPIFDELLAEVEASATAPPRPAARLSAPQTKPESASAPKPPPRYERLRELGAGAMGEVYEARDRSLLRTVALKTLKGQPTRAKRERFVKEVRVTAQLDHPGVVPVYGMESEDDTEIVYAMKLVKGLELAQLIAEARRLLGDGQPLDPDHRREQLLEHLRRVSEAVAFAHSRGVVHRDLKPANIMVGRFGEVYLMDWGIARVRATDFDVTEIETETPLDRTRPGAVLGTPIYMSPEQAAGATDSLDGQSDQYALGLILQEILTLRPPRATEGGLREMLQIARKGGRQPLEPYPGDEPIPRELRAIVERATQIDPAARYDSVEAFADDLQRFLLGEEVEAAPDNLWQRMARRLAQHRLAALGSLIVLAVVAVASVVTVSAVVHEARTMRQAREREQVMEALVDEATTKALAVDSELLRHELRLERLAGAAAVLLPKDARGGDLAAKLLDAFEAGRTGSLDSPLRLGTDRVFVVVASGEAILLKGEPSGEDHPGSKRYQAAVEATEPVWDVIGGGGDGAPALACLASVRDGEGAVLGVVGLELVVESTQEVLSHAEAPWDAAWLLDGEGVVVVAEKGATAPDAQIAEAMQDGRRGLVERDESALVIAPIDTAGWALVATVRQAPLRP